MSSSDKSSDSSLEDFFTIASAFPELFQEEKQTRDEVFEMTELEKYIFTLRGASCSNCVYGTYTGIVDDRDEHLCNNEHVMIKKEFSNQVISVPIDQNFCKLWVEDGHC